MASFVEELWNSIFTPGPTPTLLIATNVAFGSLQVLLLGLFIATYSVHFVILSVLCAGLWWSINWFSAELQRQATKEKEEDDKKPKGEGSSEADPAESDTETESLGEMKPPPSRARRPPVESSTLKLDSNDDGMRRRKSLGDSSGDLSTDSEWEKVDEGENKSR